MPSEDDINQIGQDFIDLLKRNAAEVGLELKGDLQAIADYAAARAQHLSESVGEPGFDEALVAERDNVILFSASTAIDRADAVDARILGLVEGALAMGARALALVA